MGLTLFCRHSQQVEHLEAEIEWYREQLIHERQRAEQAVDRLLGMRNIAPISIPSPDTQRHVRAEVEAMLANEEFARVGTAD